MPGPGVRQGVEGAPVEQEEGRKAQARGRRWRTPPGEPGERSLLAGAPTEPTCVQVAEEAALQQGPADDAWREVVKEAALPRGC